MPTPARSATSRIVARTRLPATGTSSDIAADWLAAGPAIVFVTLGAEGSFAITEHSRAESHAAPVTVVDTMGAGDAFMAGIIDAVAREGLLSAEAREHLRGIDPPGLPAKGRRLRGAGGAPDRDTGRRRAALSRRGPRRDVTAQPETSANSNDQGIDRVVDLILGDDEWRSDAQGALMCLLAENSVVAKTQ